MPTSDRNLEELLTVTRTVVTSAVSLNCGVKDGSNDHECQPLAAATDLPSGVVIAMGGNPQVTPGAVGDKVTVALLSGGGIIPVKVGTAGATRGQSAKYGAAGGKLVNCTPTATATTPVVVQALGYFTQTGVDGDIVGMVPCRHFLLEE